MAKKCSKCGFEDNPEVARYCAACGSPFVALSAVKPDKSGVTMGRRTVGSERDQICAIHLDMSDISVCGIDKSGKPQMMPNMMNQYSTPMVMYLDDSADIVIGTEAKRCLTTDPSRTVAFRLRDLFFDDYSRKIDDREMDRVDVMAAILMSLMKYINEMRVLDGMPEIKKAVVAVPDWASQLQNLIREVVEIAGIEVVDILPESTAALLGHRLQFEEGKNILVYNLSKKSFCASILRFSNGRIDNIAYEDNLGLGASDWDNGLIDYAFLRACYDFGLDEVQDETVADKLRLTAESCRRSLMKSENATFKFIYNRKQSRVDISRNVFVDLTEDFVASTLKEIRRVLDRANISSGQVDEVLMVGESVEMPGIIEGLKKMFSCPITSDSGEGKFAIAKGAAIYAVNKLANK